MVAQCRIKVANQRQIQILLKLLLHTVRVFRLYCIDRCNVYLCAIE